MKGVRILNVEQKKSEALRLFALGNDVGKICDLIGVSYPTLQKWRNKDVRYGKIWKKVEEESERIIFKKGLKQLAMEHQEVTDEMEWLDLDDEGRTIKRKTKIRKLPPNPVALKMLANKYEKEYNDKVYNDNSSNINIRITQRDRSLSIEERLELLESDAKGSIDCNDYKYLEEVDPPTKESE